MTAQFPLFPAHRFCGEGITTSVRRARAWRINPEGMNQ